MPAKPQFNYFLSNIKNQVQKDSKIWKSSIPVSRKQSQKASGISFCYGDYFSAARSFLSANDFKAITSAVSQLINRNINSSDIKEINIFQEKHGEFYHPARVETVVEGDRVFFVLNVAVSDAGKNSMDREYSLLKKLNSVFQSSYLPAVYSKGEVSLNNKFSISMFLGQWFEDFNEFHITCDQTCSGKRIHVWDPVYDNIFLSEKQTRQLYRQAAMILTFYYNMETFEQIFPWHHAAGDFVVKINKDKIDLKLITVRQYAPMFDNKNEIEKKYIDLKFVMEGMLVFFLNMSIRMRLDRLDGTGDIVWSDDCAVEETLKGFYQVLALKPQIPIIPAPQVDFFQDYLSVLPEKQLYDLSFAIANRYNPRSPEVPVIKDQLKSHVAVLYNSINN